MTKGEMINMLIDQAMQYRKAGIQASLNRNQHMHEFRGIVDQKQADALITDLLNYFATCQGMDLALYSKDLNEKVTNLSHRVK